MTTSVLDILIYVFDRYMLDEAPEMLERDDLARDLERAGFGHAHVERALDWLAALVEAANRSAERSGSSALSGSPAEAAATRAHADTTGAVRVFSECELARLSTECRGFLMTLERLGVLTPQQREIVVERMLALDADELDTEQLKWVVLMVLSSQPDGGQAFARMEDLALGSAPRPPH
jgi:Smg protein